MYPQSNQKAPNAGTFPEGISQKKCASCTLSGDAQRRRLPDTRGRRNNARFVEQNLPENPIFLYGLGEADTEVTAKYQGLVESVKQPEATED